MTLPLLFPFHFLLSINQISVPPCKSHRSVSYQVRISMGTLVYKEFSQACQSCPKKYHKLLIKSVCNITGLSLFFFIFTVYYFLTSYPCPLHNRFIGRKLKTYTRYEKRPEIIQAGKLQFAQGLQHVYILTKKLLMTYFLFFFTDTLYSCITEYIRQRGQDFLNQYLQLVRSSNKSIAVLLMLLKKQLNKTLIK